MKVKYVEKPMLHVRLRHGTGILDIDCLVDSGAGDCVFPVDVAEVLDIDLSDAPDKEYFPVGDGVLLGKLHIVELQVAGFDDWIPITVGFLENEDEALLGRTGFFENFEVTFRHYDKIFEIVRKKTKQRPKLKRVKKSESY